VAKPLPGPEHGPGRAEEAPVCPQPRSGPIASPAASEYFRQKGALKFAHPPHPPLSAPRTFCCPPAPPPWPKQTPPSCPNGASRRGFKPPRPPHRAQAPVAMAGRAANIQDPLFCCALLLFSTPSTHLVTVTVQMCVRTWDGGGEATEKAGHPLVFPEQG